MQLLATHKLVSAVLDSAHVVQPMRTGHMVLMVVESSDGNDCAGTHVATAHRSHDTLLSVDGKVA